MEAHNSALGEKVVRDEGLGRQGVGVAVFGVPGCADEGLELGENVRISGARISPYFKADVLVAIDDFWRQLADKLVS